MTSVVLDIKYSTGFDYSEIKFFDDNENLITITDFSYNLTSGSFNVDNRTGTEGGTLLNALIDSNTSTKLFTGDDIVGTLTFSMNTEPKYYQFVYAWNSDITRNLVHWDILINGNITATENFRNIKAYANPDSTDVYDDETFPEYLHPNDSVNKYYYINGHPDKTTVTIDIKSVYGGMDLAGIKFFDASENQIDAYTQAINLSTAVYNDFDNTTSGRNINTTTDEYQLIDNTTSKVWNGSQFTGTLTFEIAKTPTYYQFLCSSNHSPGRNINHWNVLINNTVTSTEIFKNIPAYNLNTTEYDGQLLPQFLHSGDSRNKYYYINGHPDKTTVTIDIKSVYGGMDLAAINFFDADENQIDAYTQAINLSTAVYNDFDNTTSGRNINTTTDEYQLIDNTTSKVWNGSQFTGTLTFEIAKTPTYYQFLCSSNHSPGRNINYWDVLINNVVTSTEIFKNIPAYNLNTTEYDGQLLPQFLHSGDSINKYYYINGHPYNSTVTIEILEVYDGMDLAGIKFFDVNENQIDAYTQSISFSENVYDENGNNINNTTNKYQLIDNDNSTKVWNSETFTGTLKFLLAKTPRYYQFICASNHTAGRNITYWKTEIDDLLNSLEDYREDSNYQENTTEYDGEALPDFLDNGENKYYEFNIVADYNEDGEINFYDMQKLVYDKPIDFILNGLNSSGIMTTLGTVGSEYDLGTLDASATAVFYMSQTDVRNVFQVRTDSNDLTDISSADLMHYVFMERWPTRTRLNPVNGMMDQEKSKNAMISTGVDANKMLVKHDFIRYLASKLFNTPQGADLFNNESELISGLNGLGETSYQQDISAALWKYSTTSTQNVYSDGGDEGFVLDSVTGLKATTNDMVSTENLCYIMLNQLLNKNPERFNDLAIDASGVFPLPILEGDSINYRLQINPIANQNTLTGVPEFGGRVYHIKVVIDDETKTNTNPD
jgi:hypothetical protein